jgi:DNA topoisomerase IA
MRTDFTNVAELAQKEAREFIHKHMVAISYRLQTPQYKTRQSQLRSP